MFSFLASHPPKTHTATHNPVETEDGQSSIHFFTNDPDSPYAMKAHVKPGFTIHVPPYHWHKYQSETFQINSGSMRATLEGSDTIIPAGDSITILPGQHHTFNNASDDEDLVISTGLDPMERERDEAFFRNLYSYLDDCRKEGVGPSLPQLMLFFAFL